MSDQFPNTELLKITLALAVPIWIEKVRRYSPAYRAQRARVLGPIVAEKGDVIQFKSKKKGETADAFNALAEGLAILAFAPGGVKFAGMHWEAK